MSDVETWYNKRQAEIREIIKSKNDCVVPRGVPHGRNLCFNPRVVNSCVLPRGVNSCVAKSCVLPRVQRRSISTERGTRATFYERQLEWQQRRNNSREILRRSIHATPQSDSGSYSGETSHRSKPASRSVRMSVGSTLSDSHCLLDNTSARNNPPSSSVKGILQPSDISRIVLNLERIKRMLETT